MYNKCIVDHIDVKKWKEALPDSEQILNVFKNPEDRKYFYGVLRMKRPVFCNEIDKIGTLYLLQEVAENEGYRVNAFALTDYAILLLLSSENRNCSDGNGDFLETLTNTYVSYFEAKGVESKHLLREEASWNALGGKDDILQKCYTIHALPEKKGYIAAGNKHFWSSELQYDLCYAWSFLDTAGVLGLLDRDPVKAQQKYVRDQRKRKNKEQNSKESAAAQ